VVSQRALVAAKIANLGQGHPASVKPANLPVTQAIAADLANVSERSVRSARAVLKSPDLTHAVERGKLRVSEAEKAVKLPLELQEQIADLAKDGRAKEARAAIQDAARAADEERAAIEEAKERALSFVKLFGKECAEFLLDLGNPRLFFKSLREQRSQRPAEMPPPHAGPPPTGNEDGQTRPGSRRTSKKTAMPDDTAQEHAG
jgi:hypothetical protein